MFKQVRVRVRISYILCMGRLFILCVIYLCLKFRELAASSGSPVKEQKQSELRRIKAHILTSLLQEHNMLEHAILDITMYMIGSVKGFLQL